MSIGRLIILVSALAWANAFAQAPPPMERLLKTFVGTWRASESFEVSGPARQGKTREGIAIFHAGPGPSLIEDYHSDGTAGKLDFLAMLWWDAAANRFEFLTCANSTSCHLRGTAKWEGTDLVNSWEEKIDGKAARFTDAFVDITPDSFRLVSQGESGGKIIWRVITKYVRTRS